MEELGYRKNRSLNCIASGISVGKAAYLKEKLMDYIRYTIDGNQVCAMYRNTCLSVDPAGFGDSLQEAFKRLMLEDNPNGLTCDLREWEVAWYNHLKCRECKMVTRHKMDCSQGRLKYDKSRRTGKGQEPTTGQKEERDRS